MNNSFESKVTVSSTELRELLDTKFLDPKDAIVLKIRTLLEEKLFQDPKFSDLVRGNSEIKLSLGVAINSVWSESCHLLEEYKIGSRWKNPTTGFVYEIGPIARGLKDEGKIALIRDVGRTHWANCTSYVYGPTTFRISSVEFQVLCGSLSPERWTCVQEPVTGGSIFANF